MIEQNHQDLSIRHQCRLLGLNRSSLYYQPVPIPDEEFRIMRDIDEIYTMFPSYGVIKMTRELQNRGFNIGKKRVRRILRSMGIIAIYPKPKLSIPNKEHKVYPYLLKGLKISGPDHVWCTDITYIRMRRGFTYLIAVMDWYSRYVLSWKLSVSLDTDFCVRALEIALRNSKPEIFNTDQGSQFTSNVFTQILKDHDIEISMDGKGRYLDNIFVERLWRSVKYEEVYLNDYGSVSEAREKLGRYFNLYNNHRLHQSFDYNTPASVYYAKKGVVVGS